MSGRADSLRRWLGSPTAVSYGLAAVAGLALALAFPLPGWSGLAWLAPGLLWLSVLGLPTRRAFQVGYLGGIVHFLVSMRWLLNMPFPAGAFAAWLALAAYQALYWALWSWAVACLADRVRAPDMSALDATTAGLETARRWAQVSWIARARLGVLGSCTWVALEMVRGRLMSGFPWNFLGVTQWRNAPLLQVASVTGVYGVSFLVCWCSLSLVSALVLVGAQPRNRFAWLAEARISLIGLVIVSGLGFRRILALGAGEAEAPTVTLALVQPSIRQEILWDKTQTQVRFQKIYDLSQQALTVQPDVLVWPEGCLDMEGREPFQQMLGIVTNGAASWILGSEDADRDPAGKDRYYNGAWIFDRRGHYVERYHKRRLVIFGEYVPLAKWLPFLKWLTPVGSGFDSGLAPARFPIQTSSNEPGSPSPNAIASPIICFEDIFPHGIRDHVQPDVDFLLEITNDGWFANSSAQWQHLANVLFRAVENGVPLVRCANNGVTCWVDAFGRIRDRLGATPDDVYEAGFLVAKVPLLSAGGSRRLTLYHDHGDLFGWTCVGLAGAALLPGQFSRRNPISARA